MSQQAAAATRQYRGLVLHRRAPPVACSNRGCTAMHLIENTKQLKLRAKLQYNSVVQSEVYMNNTVER